MATGGGASNFLSCASAFQCIILWMMDKPNMGCYMLMYFFFGSDFTKKCVFLARNYKELLIGMCFFIIYMLFIV
jgi:hypothetical protein